MASRRRIGGGGEAWTLVVICLLFVGFRVYTVWRGVDAASQGVLVPGGPRFGPMSGSTAMFVGACSVLAGLFGLWLTRRGARRKR